MVVTRRCFALVSVSLNVLPASTVDVGTLYNRPVSPITLQYHSMLFERPREPLCRFRSCRFKGYLNVSVLKIFLVTSRFNLWLCVSECVLNCFQNLAVILKPKRAQSQSPARGLRSGNWKTIKTPESLRDGFSSLFGGFSGFSGWIDNRKFRPLLPRG